MKRIALALTVVPSAVLAHPGDHRTSGLWHLLTEPDHLSLLAGVVAVLGYAVWKIWSRS